MKRVLLGIDGSEESLAAVAWVAGTAGLLGAEVIAASVFGIQPEIAMPGGYVMADDWIEQWRRDLQRDLDGEWTRPLREAGVTFQTEVVEGPPAEVLLRLAHEHRVDLIVVGSRGRGSLRELFLGSVSHTLSLRAPCPVVILPHRHDHAEPQGDAGPRGTQGTLD